MSTTKLVLRFWILLFAAVWPSSWRAFASEPASAVGAKVAEVFAGVRDHDFHPVMGGFTFDRRLKRHGVADLDCDDWKVRLLAVRDLVRLGNVGTISEYLNDDDRDVRQTAVMVLGILTAQSAVEPLMERLRDDDDTKVRSQAAISLGQIGDKVALPLLEQLAAADPSRDVRHQCAIAAHRIARAKEGPRGLAEAYASLDEAIFERVAVGQPAIDFELADTEGRRWRLSDFRGKKPVVLIWIFADWCPVCHSEFRDLIAMREEFTDNDVQLFTIECHEPYRARVMIGKELRPDYWFTKQSPQEFYANKTWWPHLCDLAGAVAAQYGADPLAFSVHSEWINRPTTVIVDKDGIVRLAYRGTFWGDRPSIRETLEMIRSGDFSFEHPKRLK